MPFISLLFFVLVLLFLTFFCPLHAHIFSTGSFASCGFYCLRAFLLLVFRTLLLCLYWPLSCSPAENSGDISNAPYVVVNSYGYLRAVIY